MKIFSLLFHHLPYSTHLTREGRYYQHDLLLFNNTSARFERNILIWKLKQLLRIMFNSIANKLLARTIHWLEFIEHLQSCFFCTLIYCSSITGTLLVNQIKCKRCKHSFNSIQLWINQIFEGYWMTLATGQLLRTQPRALYRHSQRSVFVTSAY